MNISEQKDLLFKQYPQDDLNIAGMQACQKPRYDRYTGILGKVASAVTLSDERAFTEARKEYIAIYNELVEAGMCFSENRRMQRAEKRYRIKDSISRIKFDLEDIGYSITAYKAKIDALIKRKGERETELRVWEDKLAEFDKEEE